MNDHNHNDDLSALIAKAADSPLSNDDAAALEELLAAHPAALDAYLDQCELHSDLRFVLRAQQLDEQIAEQIRDEERSALSDQPAGVKGSKSRRVEEEASPISNAPPLSSRASRKSLLNWASRHPKGPAYAIAATLLIAALVVMGLIPVKDWMAERGKAKPEEQESVKKEDFVARLSNWKNDVWLDGTRPPRDDPRLNIGRRLKIESGLIELTYLTGARVVIEGPAEFYVGRMKDEGGRLKKEESESEGHPSSFSLQPSNAGYLALGNLVARVKGEKAQGFTINTPSGRVEDLGTEFGVEVDLHGTAEFVVLSGKVDVVRGNGEGPEQRVRLTKNEGAFVAASGQGGWITRRGKADVRTRVASYRERLNEAFMAPVVSDETQIRFDFNGTNKVGDDPHLSGWATANTAGGTDGTVSFTVSAVGAGITIDERDRGTAATTQGAHNDDAEVPIGTYGNMYRDFIFANNPDANDEGLDLAFTGLASNTTYNVIVWAYNSSNGATSTATWGAKGGTTATSSYLGDQFSGRDPNTNALSDYSSRFQVRTDDSGAVTIEGRFESGLLLVINGIQLQAVAPSR